MSSVKTARDNPAKNTRSRTRQPEDEITSNEPPVPPPPLPHHPPPQSPRQDAPKKRRVEGRQPARAVASRSGTLPVARNLDPFKAPAPKKVGRGKSTVPAAAHTEGPIDDQEVRQDDSAAHIPWTNTGTPALPAIMPTERNVQPSAGDSLSSVQQRAPPASSRHDFQQGPMAGATAAAVTYAAAAAVATPRPAAAVAHVPAKDVDTPATNSHQVVEGALDNDMTNAPDVGALHDRAPALAPTIKPTALQTDAARAISASLVDAESSRLGDAHVPVQRRAPHAPPGIVVGVTPALPILAAPGQGKGPATRGTPIIGARAAVGAISRGIPPHRGHSRELAMGRNMGRGNTPVQHMAPMAQPWSSAAPLRDEISRKFLEGGKDLSLGPSNTAERKNAVIKMLHDRVAKLEFELPRVQGLVDGVPTMLVESLARDLKVMRMDLNEAVVHNNELQGRLAKMRVEMDETKGELEAIKQEMKKSSNDGGGNDDPKRDNITSMTVRLVLYDGMGIPRDSTALPDPLLTNEGGTREYWETVGEGPEVRRLLRPGWADTWTANEMGWARQIAETVQKDGARWNPHAKQEKLAQLPISAIVQSICVTFSSWVKAYKKSKKPLIDQSTVKQKQRRNRRKISKATSRRKARMELPAAAGPEWAFIAETAYQSTDESDDEMPTEGAGLPAVDPDTEDEGPISRKDPSQKFERAHRNKPVSHKPYVSRPPTYRNENVNEMVRRLDSIILRNSSAHTRTVGLPKEKDLPVIKKVGQVKILRSKIDPFWLEIHPENDSPLRMMDFEWTAAAGVKGDVDDEEDLYGNPEGGGWREEGEEPWEEGGEETWQEGETWQDAGGLWQIDPNLE